jgi:hypothetical protein
VKVTSIIIPSNKEFENTINKILESAKYKHLNNDMIDYIQNIRQGISQWIQKIIGKTISNISSLNSVSDSVANIFIIIGFLLMLAIVILVIIKVSKTFERKARIREILGESINDKTTPSSLRSAATNFGIKEDFRQAIRYEFIAVLLLMHEKNIIYLDETKTNEEIYKYLNKNKFNNLSSFESLSSAFNSSWYGHRHCDKNSYDKVANTVNLLWNEVLAYEEKR